MDTPQQPGLPVMHHRYCITSQAIAGRAKARHKCKRWGWRCHACITRAGSSWVQLFWALQRCWRLVRLALFAGPAAAALVAPGLLRCLLTMALPAGASPWARYRLHALADAAAGGSLQHLHLLRCADSVDSALLRTLTMLLSALAAGCHVQAHQLGVSTGWTSCGVAVASCCRLLAGESATSVSTLLCKGLPQGQNTRPIVVSW